MRLSTSVEPDRLVKTHCCFCGQQCGIQLKVRDNEVIGFEPWEDFPFNRGMLCPKGVKRYLQGSHPDRLTTALRRDTSAASGFSPMPYAEAINRVAAEIGRIQQTHGAGAIGVLGGASLTTEKTYLLGKFARVCLKTPFIDYNGRLCMVSAGAANKKAFGIDRTTNPWSDMVGHRRDLGRGLERGRVFAHHDQLHLAGARAGREDHRPGSADHAGGSHLRSVPAGEAGARRGPVRRRAADHDRARLARSRIHRRAHGGLRAGRRVLPGVDAGADRGGDRRAAACADAGR